MLFAIFTQDAPGSEDARKTHHDAHIAHFKAHKEQIALAGPLSEESGASAGSLVVFSADTLADAKAFIEADPFHPAGVWSDIRITALKASIHNADLFTS
ncbi:MAG: YciI family protein [Pseudomonadota bacterium]